MPNLCAAASLSLAALACAAAAAPAQTVHTGHDAHRLHADPSAYIRALDDPARDAWQRPHDVIVALDLKPGETIADIGAGSGYFSLRFARHVGTDGRVFAVDVSKDMVAHLEAQARTAGLGNLRAVLAPPDDPQLPDAAVDRVFFCDVWHHINDQTGYLAKLKEALRPTGEVVMIDFHERDLPVGPPVSMKIAREDLIAQMQSNGFRLVREHTFLPYQYFLVFRLAGRQPDSAASRQPPAASPSPRYLTLEEARPILAAAGALAPAALRAAGPDIGTTAWDQWVRAHDAATRARVARGEDDSLAYLLVFGTSYTRAPRLTASLAETFATTPPAQRAAPTLDALVAQAMTTRLDDLIAGMRRPGANARLAWARAAVERHGHRLDTPPGRQAARVFLLENYARVSRESAELGERIARAETAGSREADLAARARLFADRGLAPDTNWPINFALDDALAALTARDTVAPSTVRYVAIVGPGLDFVDKDEGYDTHPPQTLQPFAVMDALLARGLSTPTALRVTAIDLSPRVLEHVRAVAAPDGPVRIGATRGGKALSPRAYGLTLLRDPRVPWTEAARGYWDAFGRAIAVAAPRERRSPNDAAQASPVQQPAGGTTRPEGAGIEIRAIPVDPAWPRRIDAIDLNVVCQRVDLPAGERFDLLVATNVLLYYDAFEQALAAANLAHLLAPGGLLLTNTRLDDVPAFPLRRVQETATAFSTRPGDGEYVYAYGAR